MSAGGAPQLPPLVAPPVLPGYRHVASGKVRELYEPQEGGPHLLLVATDRISVFDHVLSTAIPDKGRVLTALSRWWFDQLADLVPHHLVPHDPVSHDSVSHDGAAGQVPDQVAGRALLVRRLVMFPVECVARGYLTGSGLAEYAAAQAICGVPLPGGLVDGSRLPEPIFTPATKVGRGRHDENLTFDQLAATVGPDDAATLRGLTLAVYRRAERIAAERGVVVASTKLELGRDQAGRVVLGDEALTPDSSRLWAVGGQAAGEPQHCLDKQVLREWLLSPASGWDRHGDAPPPPLPDDVVLATQAAYRAAHERLTGTPLA